jgi:ribosome-associated translation inhibitor RaiA
MNIIYSHIAAESRAAVQTEVERHVEKFDRLLKHYDPDSIELHGSVEKIPRKPEYSFSLNLKMPTATLHSTGIGADIPTSAKAAFAEIETQVKKHQEKLRKDYIWKRKRGPGLPKLGEMTTAD